MSMIECWCDENLIEPINNYKKSCQKLTPEHLYKKGIIKLSLQSALCLNLANKT